MADVYIALGANLGDREANLRSALRAISGSERVVAVSSLFETEAVTLDGSEGPPYYNAACRIETELEPLPLLRFLQSVERQIGRPAEARRWAPRLIDLDLLLYGSDIVETDDLTVPHPLMAERPFVLVPLAEIAAGLVHPVLNRTIADLAEEAGDAGVRRITGERWDGLTGDGPG
ncbi:MAG: 2-amino-4-hydroxy-6-hydroxymethyldihydropteridine diphosphokinase [Chloroflexi bacterium]|nr:2-amino-4-hydroxy-6-hydroxymethyldihydropteridine diphosphokinase [Chloroflexota bacterium]